MAKYTSGAEALVLEPGIYNFEVKKATNKRSKANNEMIELVLDVEGGSTVWDYLVFDTKSAWKIDQFRKAVGDNVVAGEEVELDASDCEGKYGFAKFTVGTYKGKQSNKVEEYIVKQDEDKF